MGCEDGKGSPEMGWGPGNRERGGSRAGDGPEMETREQLE